MNRSQRQRAENEVVFKQRNNIVKRMAKDLQHDGLGADVVLKFTCECASEDCHDTIGLTVRQYESTRRNSRQFIVRQDHVQKDIEKVVKYAGYSVVEKFEEPPPTNGILNKATDNDPPT